MRIPQDSARFDNTTVTGNASAILGSVNNTTYHYHFPLAVGCSTNLAAVFTIAREIYQNIEAASRSLEIISTLHNHALETTPSRTNDLSQGLTIMGEKIHDYKLLEGTMNRLHLSAGELCAHITDNTQDTHLKQLASRCYDAFPQICNMFQDLQNARNRPCKELSRSL